MDRLNQGIFRCILLSLLLATNVASVNAQEEEDAKDAYVGLAYSGLNIKGIPGSLEGNQVSAVTLTLGTYITDYVRTEVRAGFGIDDVTTGEGLKVGADSFYSWYIGGEYPMIETLSLYGLLGFSHFTGNFTRAAPRTLTYIPDDLVDSSFGVSYVVGAKFRIVEGIHAFTDYGRLHSDTITGITTKQFQLGLSYAF